MRAGLPFLVVIAIVVALVFALQRERSEGARFLRLAGFGVVALSTVFFGAFVVGDTLADPGGWAALGLIALWAVPLVGLAALAWYRPDWATWVLAVLVATAVGVSIWFAVAPGEWRSFEDRHGPIRVIVTFALVAAIAVLGLRRTAAAGVLLLVVGIVPVVVSSIGSHPGLPSLAIVSSAPVVAGILYLLSARMADHHGPSTAGEPGEEPRSKAA